MTPNKREQLRQLLADAQQALEAASTTEEFELFFVKLLTFLKEHPEARAEASQAFLRFMRCEPGAPQELIEFCMHELKWPEILDYGKHQLASEQDLRRRKFYEDIIEAYGREWRGHDLYAYYRKN